ncbi:MAG: adenosylcobinamide-phosphate synthase CbiB [Anaerolineae bacterium]
MKAQRKKALCLALLLDLTLGDPPNRYHPVAWMGIIIAAARRRAPRRTELASLAYGALLAVGGTATAAGVGRLLERAIARLTDPWNWLTEAVLLKMTFSLRGLATAAREVELALETGDLPEARRLVGWHLVSRDTIYLNASQVAAATVESVAENTSDGIVGPLLYYAVGGLPAALAYRFINTADAMLGYRSPSHEWLGKVPAHVDDLANLLPARLTAGLLILAAVLADEDAGGAWRIWRRDAWKTASPNAGHPMSAMAGALDIELEKVGHYRLGAGQRLPEPEDIQRAVRLAQIVTALAAGVLVKLLTPLKNTGQGPGLSYPSIRRRSGSVVSAGPLTRYLEPSLCLELFFSAESELLLAVK